MSGNIPEIIDEKNYPRSKHEQRTYTASTAFMEALKEAGVSYIFANLGSDHPALIEDWAQAKRDGEEYPEVIICSHEMVALSAAHTYAQITGEAQAVIVHVECGTQNLGGAIHNASKGKVPVLIFAGASPYTQEGELVGSRNEFIHWIQDVPDQRGIVRGYTKYDNEVRTGRNMKQLVHRALQISQSEPKGPVYLMAAREVLEEEVEPVNIEPQYWGAISPSALANSDVSKIVNNLVHAKSPLIITSYLGRNTDAVQELVELSEKLAVPVIESAPNYVNFPGDHPMHLGYQWNTAKQNEWIAKADCIIVIDSDVPWIQLNNRPSQDCKVYYLDVDPLKETTPLWYVPSEGFYKVDSNIALQQLNDQINTIKELDKRMISARYEKISKVHEQQRNQWKQDEEIKDEGVITPEFLTGTIRDVIEKENTIVLTEAITNYGTVSKHLSRNEPGTLFGSGASSLGWHGGAGVGASLASPEKTVICLTGDGSYIFSNPTPVHMMSNRYDAAFLTIIYNNAGWGAPRMSTLGVHPEGTANETDQFWVNFGRETKLAKVAEAAGGAFAKIIQKPEELKPALKRAINMVKKGRSVVLDVHLPPVSNQPLR